MGRQVKMKSDSMGTERAAAPAEQSFVNVFDLRVSHHSSREIVAVNDFSYKFAENQFYALVGPSGCGKSSLLNTIAGLHAPTAGRVEIGGTLVSRKPYSSLGYVFQTDALLPWRSIRANVALGLRLARVPKEDARQRVDDVLAIVGLTAFADELPSNLSGGMRRRAQLAQMIVGEPRLLLLDEPFSSLDEPTRVELHADVLRLWQRSRQTAILVTHDIAEAITLADTVIVLTNRPASIYEVFHVDIARPRNAAHLRESREFMELYSSIWGALFRQIEGSS